MFTRDILVEFGRWAQKKERKPLVLRGAGQTGKTTVVKMFGASFDQFIYLNLEKKKERVLFEANYSFEDLLNAIFLYGKSNRANKNTLLFIDEIQNSPEAIASLRYFYEEASDIYVVAAGSLLESMLHRNISFPVGRVEYLAIRPCTFKEFLNATGEKMYLDLLNQTAEIPDYAHADILEAFNRYTLIGGMPEIVQIYSEHRDISRLNSIYESLIASYMDDVEKYAISTAQVRYIRHIIQSVFTHAGERVTFEKFGESEYKSREMKEAFLSLEKSMLINLVYPQTQTNLPVAPNLRKKPRLHVLDTGLANYRSGIQLDLLKSDKIEDVYRGRIAEHIAGQEILASDTSILHRLGFWIRDKKTSMAEVDYLIPFEGMLIPVEVKSGSSGKLKSMHLFMQESGEAFAIRLYSGTYSREDVQIKPGKGYHLINVPIYKAYDLEKIIGKEI